MFSRNLHHRLLLLQRSAQLSTTTTTTTTLAACTQRLSTTTPQHSAQLSTTTAQTATPPAVACLHAPQISLQPVSVTRKMAAALPRVKALAAERGTRLHHLGAGYPHPEVTDPRGFIAHAEAFHAHVAKSAAVTGGVTATMREDYSYGDTLGPRSVREAFAHVYGRDWSIPDIDPDAHLVPTVGATGGISLLCSLFERAGVPLAYITDAPTYAGFLARATLASHASIYSVAMDAGGPILEELRTQIRAARADGKYVPFYYTIPDGHNPGGISFSAQRRAEIVQLLRDEGVLVVEDAPYSYINFQEPLQRPLPFASLAPDLAVHLFTGSKIGFPGPRVGFMLSQATVKISDGSTVPLASLFLTEASADTLFHNPSALRSFEAMLRSPAPDFHLLDSLWPVAEKKLVVYRTMRKMMLQRLDDNLAAFDEHFSWTRPDAGFFVVLTLKGDAAQRVTCDDAFVLKLMEEYGLVVVPMVEFYPADARARDAAAGLTQLRLSFCFNEGFGDERIEHLRLAIDAFCSAMKIECGLVEEA
jgi:DNA-binding transcriptional MocR family regulator